jgi:hypothetical protein
MRSGVDTGKKRPMTMREAGTCRYYAAAFGTILGISECFQRSKLKLYIFFSLEQDRLKIKKNCLLRI